MKKTPLITKLLFAGILVLVSAGFRTEAGTFSTDFNSGVPPGMALQGVAKVEADASGGTNTTGVLKLTEANVGNSSGGAILDDLDSGATVNGFEANFSLHIGRGNGADGMSFFFGDFNDAAYSEEGPGGINGITVAFDVFNNATGSGVPEAPAIDIKWNNVILVHRLIGAASATTGAAPIGSLNTIRTATTANGNSTNVPVKIRVETDGRFSLAFNNTVVYTNLPIFRPITNITINTSGLPPRFGFGARTGGSHDDHWIDNLQITTVTTPAGGQPFASVISPVSLSSATAGAPASAVGGAIVALQDSTFSVATNSIVLLYNNAAAAPISIVRSKSLPGLPADDLTTIGYFGPNGVLPTGVGTVTLSYATTSTPALSNTFSYSFVVAAPTTLPASWAVSGVDTNKPGFKARVYQMDAPRVPGDQNVTMTGERQVNRGFKDPATGQPYPDISNFSSDPSSLDSEGYVAIPGTVNFDQGAANRGSINGTSNPPRPEELFPGIPGPSGSLDNFAIEFVTFVELPAGGHRFGLLADDRFRFAFGPASHAAGIPILAASTGASQETYADVIVTNAGVYPLRVSYWEGGGDAHIELFYIEKGTNRKILLNDPELPAPHTFRQATGSRPTIARVLPVEGYIGVFPNEDVLVEIIDGGISVDVNSIVLRINNVDQTITKPHTGKITTVTRAGSVGNLLPSGLNTVNLIYSFTENNVSVTVTNVYTFTVAPYYNSVPLATRALDTEINKAETGFHVRYHQLDRSLNTVQGDGGRIGGLPNNQNRMPLPEMQLTDGFINPTNGLAYTNLAKPGPNANFTADLDVINFQWGNASGAAVVQQSGFFRTDQPPGSLPGKSPEQEAPGLPGSGTSNFGLDNYTMEAITYLDLKKGVYVFAMNSDDGYVISTSPNPQDTLGTILGFYNGGRGNATSFPVFPNNVNPPVITPGTDTGSTPFSVVVPEDGVYPFRILYWQGGGGVNAEFFVMNKESGRVMLVNDLTGDASVTMVPAYRGYTGPAKPWTRFSVSPTPWDNKQQQQTGPGPLKMVGRTRNSANSSDIYNSTDNIRPWADVRIGGVVANGVGDPTLRLLLDGTAVAATFTTNGTDVTLSFKPAAPFASGSTHTNALVYGSTTNRWTFTVQTYVGLPTTSALSLLQTDTNSVGFRARIFQAATAQANTVARAESQITGGIPNVALAGPNADGSYTFPGFINWNTRKVTGGPGGPEIGNFQDNTYGIGWPFPDYVDDPVPGIPGTGLSGAAGRQNVAAEIFAYLRFDTPGYYRLGVNGDDGWAVKLGTPGVTNGTVLFTVDRGAGAADIPFSITVPQAGLYPVRLVWYQGGGEGDLEFFSYDTNGNKIPINDTNNPAAIKAYYNVLAAPAIVITSPTNNTVYPGSPANVTITADATVQNSAIALVEFYRGTNKIGEATAFPYSVVWNNVGFGPYLLTAKATAANGISGVSAPVKIFVGTPVISNVVETGGDNEATDTVPAKWTGVTYVGGVANEPIAGLPAGASYMVDVFQEDAPAYVDRNHQWNGATAALPLPSYLVGNEYIMSGNDNRDNATYKLDITLSQEANVYLLVDNRLQDGNAANPPTFTVTNMNWLLTNGWTPVTNGLNRAGNPAWPDEVGVDEGGDGVGPGVAINNWSSVYVKRIPASTFSIFQADNAGQNMYGVVIARIPLAGLQFTSATLSGGAATFTWTGTAILQKATVLTGSNNDWSDVNPQPGGNTYQVQVSSATQTFYRLKQ